MKWLAIVLVGVSLYASKLELPSMGDALAKSCTQCHMAYQGGFLPKRSWEELLKQESLKDHFGVQVELGADAKKGLMEYYLKHAADVATDKSTKRIARSIKPGTTPLRPSKVRFIANKHDELDPEMITGNSDVKFYGNCNACHGENAIKGIFLERDVEVPGYVSSAFGGWKKTN